RMTKTRTKPPTSPQSKRKTRRTDNPIPPRFETARTDSVCAYRPLFADRVAERTREQQRSGVTAVSTDVKPANSVPIGSMGSALTTFVVELVESNWLVSDVVTRTVISLGGITVP